MPNIASSWKRFLFLGVCCFAAPLQAHPDANGTLADAAAPSIVGEWETIDDVTHKVKSLVLLQWDGSRVSGRIVKVLDPAAKTHAVCERCSGARRGQAIEGLQFLWGLTQSVGSRQYDGGTVLDPSNGKEYRCRVRLMEDGQLEIRGFIGLPVFGRTQVWRRPSGQPATKAKA